jgi:hypothetical protein
VAEILLLKMVFKLKMAVFWVVVSFGTVDYHPGDGGGKHL